MSDKYYVFAFPEQSDVVCGQCKKPFLLFLNQDLNAYIASPDQLEINQYLTNLWDRCNKEEFNDLLESFKLDIKNAVSNPVHHKLSSSQMAHLLRSSDNLDINEAGYYLLNDDCFQKGKTVSLGNECFGIFIDHL